MPLPKDFKRTIGSFEYQGTKYYIVETDKGLILDSEKSLLNEHSLSEVKPVLHSGPFSISE